MTMINSADIVWRHAICVAITREWKLFYTNASECDWIMWHYGSDEKKRQEYILWLKNSCTRHRPLIWKWLETEHTE